MKAKKVFEKFTEDSDPIKDLRIGKTLLQIIVEDEQKYDELLEKVYDGVVESDNYDLVSLLGEPDMWNDKINFEKGKVEEIILKKWGDSEVEDIAVELLILNGPLQ